MKAQPLQDGSPRSPRPIDPPPLPSKNYSPAASAAPGPTSWPLAAWPRPAVHGIVIVFYLWHDVVVAVGMLCFYVQGRYTVHRSRRLPQFECLAMTTPCAARTSDCTGSAPKPASNHGRSTCRNLTYQQQGLQELQQCLNPFPPIHIRYLQVLPPPDLRKQLGALLSVSSLPLLSRPLRLARAPDARPHASVPAATTETVSA